MADIVKHFDILTEKDMQVIPLHAGCKNPVFMNWQSIYDQDACRNYLQANPNSNIGLKLGEIIDVEGDSLQANKLVDELIGDYPHPSYTSRKSKHHLFITPDESLTRLVFQDIEFRGHRHQSVLPPSIVNGIQYKWETTSFPIPVMPARLLAFYEKIKFKQQKKKTKPGHIKLPCVKCRKDCYLHRKRFQEELAVFKSFDQQWQCRECRDLDLRPICRKNRNSQYQT